MKAGIGPRFWRSPDLRGTISAALREQVTARYAYWLKLELAAGQAAVVEGFQVAAPWSLTAGAARKTRAGRKPDHFRGPAPSVRSDNLPLDRALP